MEVWWAWPNETEGKELNLNFGYSIEDGCVFCVKADRFRLFERAVGIAFLQLSLI